MEPAPPIEPLSEPMRRVMEALVAGMPAPPEAQTALTEAEKAEVAALARTSHLARVALEKSAPPEEAEEKARERAQSVLITRPLTEADRVRFQQNNPPPAGTASDNNGGLRAWWDRLRGKRRDG